jgi:SAM-dependent methyltransferase
MANVRLILYSVLLFISLGSFCLTGCYVPYVRYVPTPDDVVVDMLQLARVDRDDLVYDLGCGDGRFVVTAAKVFGARAVGVDIDPDRIRESEENARREGVMDRVKFFVQDLFQTDIREATVVTLYLFPDLNLKLRPKLFRELRPGARVLSYQYGMGEWEPDSLRTVAKPRISPKETAPVYYFWVIPADAAGVWRWRMTTSGGDRDYFLRLVQTFQKISGKLEGQSPESRIEEPRLSGDQISFTIVDETQGRKALIRLHGRISGNSIEGDATVQGGPDEGHYSWAAKRDR